MKNDNINYSVLNNLFYNNVNFIYNYNTLFFNLKYISFYYRFFV